MRPNRLRSAGAALARAVVASLRENVGELLLALGLVLIMASLWPAFGRLALLPVGAVLVWIALPSRRVFVERPPETKSRRTT